MRLWILLLTLITTLHAETITVIGIGRMGLCLALCLEKAGYEVLGVDLSPEYVKSVNEKTLQSPEPNVNEYLRASTHFRATTSLDEGLQFANLYFIVVPTNPSQIMGKYDCAILDDVLLKINQRKVEGKHIVVSSTVFPGYVRNAVLPALKDCPNTSVTYNPMFIAQGDILKGMQFPEVVLIGSESDIRAEEVAKIHSKFCMNAPYVAKMTPDSAEITKLALNCYVTMKIAFANMVGDIADATPGGDKEAILAALGHDGRIGQRCLFAGYGFGGPCFPRDNRALGEYASLLSIDPVIFRATDSANQQHADRMAQELLQMDLAEYLFEDVCYKPKCPVPIIEESQKLQVAKRIAEAGKRVFIKDRPEVIQAVKTEFGDLFEYIEEIL